MPNFRPRDLLIAFTLVVGFACGAVAHATQPATVPTDSETPTRPNVLFIFADDQCFDTIRSRGNTEIQTPNLDALVRRGTTFSHCYNMGSWSGAVCVASRTMLNTGRFVWSANDVYDTSRREMKEGRWWSQYMRSAGYKTYMTGKWHVRAPAEESFDVVRDVRGGMPRQTKTGYNRPLADGTDPWDPSDPSFGGFWEGGKHWSEVVGDHGVEFLDMASNDDAPFFMYLAFNAPHDPRQSPQEFVDRYPAAKIDVPKNFLPVYPHHDAIGCGPKLRDARLAPFPRTPSIVQKHRQEYYAIITHMDQQIGRILKALKDTGKSDNTYIVFTADHGLACGQHGLMGKQNLYDHSVRVPMMIVGPGIAADRVIDSPAYLQDAMATTLQWAGVEKPTHVDFHSLVPRLKDPSVPSPYKDLYGAYLKLQRSVRTDQYKLIVYPQANAVRLYDVKQDPLEMNDLAGQASHRETINDLWNRLVRLQKQLGDDLVLDRSIID